jgi:methyltransferase family protein
MSRAIRTWLKGGARRMFEAGQRCGLDLLPRHFYSEIPDVSRLRHDRAWRKPFGMRGVRGAAIDGQLEFVAGCCSAGAVDAFRAGDTYAAACRDNGAEGYGPIEAALLYCFVRARMPSRIFQVGSGVSTAICLRAAAAAGYTPQITCVDPFPTPFLRRAGAEGTIRLLPERVQDLDPAWVDPLADGDLMFIDSTHTLGPAGEVTRLMLETLPRLAGGVWVHFHDIGFPYDYTRRILSSELFFPHETALLLAFLTFNDRFRLVASMSMLHYACPAELAKLIPWYRPAGNDDGLERSPGHFPSSAYLRVADAPHAS